MWFCFLVLGLFETLEKIVWWKWWIKYKYGGKTVTCWKVLCLRPLVLVGKVKVQLTLEQTVKARAGIEVGL